MIALREAWAQRLVDAGAQDRRILVLDGDLANSTKAELFADAHPEQFLQMGIAEQNMIGVAAGLAAHGYIPWLSSFAVFFSHRALDPIRMLVAQTGANVKIAGGYAGLLTGATGKTHQDVQDLAIFRAMPGMVVLCPADAHECRAMIDWANRYDGPVYLRLTRDPGPDVFAEGHEFHPGSVLTLRSGSDVALISTGTQTARVLDAATKLGGDGIEAAVIHLPGLKPVDAGQLLAALSGHTALVVVEEHSVYGGLGGLVTEIATAHGSSPRILRLGIQDRWGESGTNEDLLTRFGLSADCVAASVAAHLSAMRASQLADGLLVQHRATARARRAAIGAQ